MFDDMIEAIREDTAKLMLTVEIISESEQREKALARLRMANAVSALSAGPKKKPIRNTVAKIGRNDPCPCGSGKKYKKCCGRTPEVSA
jgi:preprotein translocase subunit SecA